MCVCERDKDTAKLLLEKIFCFKALKLLARKKKKGWEREKTLLEKLLLHRFYIASRILWCLCVCECEREVEKIIDETYFAQHLHC